jgi:hypothetical protein
MSRPLKIILYLVCIGAAVGFGIVTLKHYRRANQTAAAQQQKLDDAAGAEAAPATPGSTKSYSSMVTYGLLTFLAFGGFAVLLARDVSHFFAGKATYCSRGCFFR